MIDKPELSCINNHGEPIIWPLITYKYPPHWFLYKRVGFITTYAISGYNH